MQHCYHWIRGAFLMWNIPNPPSYPIIGSAHLVINKTSIGACVCVCYVFKLVLGANVLVTLILFVLLCFLELFQIATYWASQLGVFFKFWLGPELLIGILDSKDIEVGINCVIFGTGFLNEIWLILSIVSSLSSSKP